MPHTTLVGAPTLHAHLDEAGWAVVDCRFALGDPDAGRADYRAAHIPGAVYAHLDDDLSGPIVPGVTGRHPLPDPAVLAATFGRWGVADGVQVVAYDDAGGAMAARLWWLLRWLGHDAVAVLDGGWTAWQDGKYPTQSGDEACPPAPFVPRPRPDRLADAATVDAMRADAGSRLLDARAAIRFRGEVEPIDPVAGHVPGALSAPFSENLTSDGRFADRDALAARFRALTGGVPAERVVHMCGSGVTACHNALATVHAGLGEPRVYVGSWSEWITDPDRPIAEGE